jgi:ATP/ADP translocase
MKKLLPLAMMFFCVLFNYTILRNTKVLHAQDEHIIFRFAFL